MRTKRVQALRSSLWLSSFLGLVMGLSAAAPARAQVSQACSPSTFGKPIAVDDTETYPAAPLTILVLNNDRDQNGGELWVSSTSGVGTCAAPSATGKAVIFNPQCMPAATSAQFTYTIHDAENNTATATVTLTPRGGSATVTESCSTNVCTLRAVPTLADAVKAYKWTFGDGLITDNWRGTSIVHTYAATFPKSYNVEVTLYYETREPVTVQKTITVTDNVDIVWRSDHDNNSNAEGSRLTTWITTTTLPSAATYAVHWDDNGDGATAGEPWVGLSYDTEVGRSQHHFYDLDGTHTVRYRKCFGSTCTEYPRPLYVANAAPNPYIESKRVDGTTKTFEFKPWFIDQYSRVFSTWDEYEGNDPIYKPQPYEYDFGDGTHDVGTWRSDGHPDVIRHTYTRPGTYLVKLRVTDDRGKVGWAWDPTITVPDEGPAASFTFDCKGLGCVLDGSGSTDDKGVVMYMWSFSFNGTPYNDLVPKTPLLPFPAGTHTVTLTVKDELGHYSAPVTRLVTVTDAAPSAPLNFYSITPCRLYDSRSEGQSALATGVPREVAISGNCGIPVNGVKAVAANFTVVNPTANGNLQAYPVGAAIPGSSVLNLMTDRAPRSAGAVVGIANGRMVLYPSLFPPAGTAGQTDVIIDVTGYFTTDTVTVTGANGPLGYEAFAPCRIFDSRLPGVAGPIINPTPALLKVRGKCGMPSEAPSGGMAAALNLTLVGASANGNVVVYPSSGPAPSPATSVLNPRAELSPLSNGLLTSLGARSSPDDDLAIAYNSFPSGGSTHYVVDATGYFAPGAGLRYFPVPQCVVADTRNASRGDARLPANVDRYFAVQGNCGVPRGAVAAALTVTAFQPDGNGYLLLFPSDTAVTTSSSLSFTAGENAVTTTALAALAPGALDLGVRSTQGTHLIVSVSGYFAPNDINGPVPNQPPAARFAFNCSGLDCQFDASQSTDDGTIHSYQWTFGSASLTTLTPQASFHFDNGNAYLISLQVSDGSLLSPAVYAVANVNGEAPGVPTAFFPIASCRLFDSRSGAALVGGATKLIPVTGAAGGPCAIPATARAAALNLTVVSPSVAGDLTVWNGSLPRPVPTTVNFTPENSPRANNAVAALDAAGNISVRPSLAGPTSSTHLTVDAYGYFAADTAPAAGARGPYGYQPVTPCRIFDSRASSAIASGELRYLKVDRSLCGVPSGPAALAMNLAIVGPTAGGHATLFSSALGLPPAASTINFNPLINLANGAAVELGGRAADDLGLKYVATGTGSTHAVLDTTGYFSTAAPLAYQAIRPCRLLDTREPSYGVPRLAKGQTTAVQVQGNCGVPRGARAAALNVTVVAPDAPGNLDMVRSDRPFTSASAVNFQPSDSATANGVLVELSALPLDLALRASLAGGSGAHVVLDVVGYFVPR
jgi:hypothetical protein